MGVNTANAISRQYIIPLLLPAAGTLSMSIKENYSSGVNHRLVTDLPLVISGWLKVDRRSTARIIVRRKFVMEVMQAFFYYRHTEKTSSCASNGTNCVMCISYDLWKCYLYCYKKQYIFFYYDTLVHPMERSVCFVLYCNKTNSMTDCAS